MSTIEVKPPYPAFAGADGQPLEDGYIWIGVVNLSPQVNPIAVYWDDAQTIAAVQPIRTQGGYPVYQGTPSRFYTASDYSIQVLDSKGSVVYTSLNGNSIGSGSIASDANKISGFVPTGAPLSAAALASAMGGGAMGFLKTLGTAASIGAITRIYESAPVRNLMIKIPRTIPGSKEEAALMKRLNSTMQTEFDALQQVGNQSQSPISE
jgi:hypothetical protein